MEAVKDFDTFYTLKIAPLLDQLSAEKKQSGNSIFQVVVYSLLTIASPCLGRFVRRVSEPHKI